MPTARNRRAGVEDRWTKLVRQPDGTTQRVPSALHGKGLRWRARYVDQNGKEHSKAFARKVDATAWADEQVSDQVTGTWVDPALSGVTFGTMAERWMLTKVARGAKTVAGYRSILDVIVLPRWKTTPLRDVQFDGLQVWISGLSVDGSTRFEGQGLSASRVRQVHQLIGAVLKFAVRAKHLPSNPAEGIELPRLPEVHQRFLSHGQLHELAIAAGRFRTLILVLGYCGLRFGEAVGLQVGDVDLKARRIRVARSVTNVAGRGMVEGPTKNHQARTVPIPKFLVPLLKTEMADRSGAALVFPPRKGEWLSLGELRWAFDRALTTLRDSSPEFPAITPHDLRHTCASLAISAGANIKVLQTLLGHKTATLTLDRYGHLFPDDLGRIADAFDEAARATADSLRTETPLRPVPDSAKTL